MNDSVNPKDILRKGICPSCSKTLFIRASLDGDTRDEGSPQFDEIWECDNHHLWKAIYVLKDVVQLMEVSGKQ